MRKSKPLSPVLLAQAESIVRERTGLVFREPRRSALMTALEAGVRRSGVAEADEYIERLSAEPRLLDDLIEEITVGETYFFRDEKQFSAIRDLILPELSASSEGRALRLWSAGCATGEEAYSLAILMRERGEAARVIGTDISRRAMAHGRTAVYRDWSLRGVPDAVVRRYFRRSHGRFELDHAIRDAVEFRHLNLARHGYSSLESGVADMDLILCRNVLIYFDASTVAEVAARLIDSLHPDGWLLVGASDPPLQDLVSCDMVVTNAGSAYRRPARRTPDRMRSLDREITGVKVAEVQGNERATSPLRSMNPARSPVRRHGGLPLAPARAAKDLPPRRPTNPARPPIAARTDAVSWNADAREQIADLYRTRRYDEAAEFAAHHAGRDAADAAVWIMLVRAQANLGELRLADAACLAALEHHPLNAELAYLHGVLMLEAGRATEAVQAFRRAIYLDRALVVAHVALGQLLSRTGRSEGARRAFRNAEQLLAAMAPEAVVTAADGETAARLLSLTRTQAALADVATS